MKSLFLLACLGLLASAGACVDAASGEPPRPSGYQRPPPQAAQPGLLTPPPAPPEPPGVKDKGFKP
jgi:hypothetical protein